MSAKTVLLKKVSFMKTVLVFFVLGFAGPISAAQQPSPETEIRQVIEKLFTAMQKGDSTMLKECFSKEVSLATIYRNKNDEPVILRENSIASFVKAVGTPHQETWYEEYWNLGIRIDGDLASAWCDYAFYRGNTFSHCGADAFHFHREKEGWKIFHLSDTRRKSDCVIPDEIRRKHQGR